MAQARVRFLASQYVERFVEGDGIERPTSPPSRVQPVSLARASAAATNPRSDTVFRAREYSGMTFSSKRGPDAVCQHGNHQRVSCLFCSTGAGG